VGVSTASDNTLRPFEGSCTNCSVSRKSLTLELCVCNWA
jgi:hypothetical protein